MEPETAQSVKLRACTLGCEERGRGIQVRGREMGGDSEEWGRLKGELYPYLGVLSGCYLGDERSKHVCAADVA